MNRVSNIVCFRSGELVCFDKNGEAIEEYRGKIEDKFFLAISNAEPSLKINIHQDQKEVVSKIIMDCQLGEKTNEKNN